MHARVEPSLYQQLESLPPGLIGEILNGQLHTQPRPSGPHAYAASALGAELFLPFSRGRGGQGGWWIIDEPELHFLLDEEVEVPDIAGWRRQRMPRIPEGHRFSVVPDWVCEVLSPSTESKDRELKMPIYAHFGVAFAWLLDPRKRLLETYALHDGAWRETGRFGGDDRVRAAPFEAVTIALDDLWTS
ncbi:MAG: Uma2 family endonuclease [Lamprobacter sp.]|uniref:Uma2 family endonuclease n=1 Tax=Lamprobacter sp. TaxID=3100796 RepID=UPI002B263EFF|nr:Uma2 family endonuclease [Lamprobacter sp.]MEA3643896.1 Uma2 family endonuclease [Lamprobacter sp.]